MKTGVYQIRNLENDKLYIGSTTDSFHQRWATHRHQLKQSCHHSIKLQRAWNKYGEGAFVFEVLERCPAQLCIETEQQHLNALLFASHDDNRFDRMGYNVCRTAGSTLGRKFSKETIDKISGKNHHSYGKKFSESHKSAMRRSHWSKNNPRAFREHISGENNPHAKLTLENVNEIQRLLRQGLLSQAEIANKFGVKQSAISKIKTGRRW